MPWNRSVKQVVEDTGHALEAELDEFLADHSARVQTRAESVQTRLASLEAELSVLERTAKRHGAASS